MAQFVWPGKLPPCCIKHCNQLFKMVKAHEKKHETNRKDTRSKEHAKVISYYNLCRFRYQNFGCMQAMGSNSWPLCWESNDLPSAMLSLFTRLHFFSNIDECDSTLHSLHKETRKRASRRTQPKMKKRRKGTPGLVNKKKCLNPV